MAEPNKKSETYHASEIFEQLADLVSARQFAERLASTLLNSKPGSREEGQAVQSITRMLNRHEDKHPDVTDEDLRDMTDEDLQGQIAAILGATEATHEQPAHTAAAD